jgi:hypothetical protein
MESDCWWLRYSIVDERGGLYSNGGIGILAAAGKYAGKVTDAIVLENGWVNQQTNIRLT